jgi:SAM-dependent methyltransferase
MLRRPSLLLTLAAALLPFLPLPAGAQSGEEVPFITTPDNVTLAMLQLAGVGPADRVIDLGSGDGRIVITAARRFGARGLGVEIVPDLVARSHAAAARAGVADRVEFREQDLFKTDLTGATVVTMYLLPEVNLQLRPTLLQLAPGTRIVSHDWDLGDWMPDETLTVDAPDKQIGREKKSRLHRWVVPARADGLWCGAAGVQLRLTQRYQAVQALWQRGDRQQALQGRLDGRDLRLLGAGAAPLQAQVDGDRLLVSAPATDATTLTRAHGERCPG